MSKVKIKQVRSAIDRSKKQKRTLQALGLRKINGTVEHEMNDTLRGMIFRVSHLVEVEEIGSETSEVGSKKSSPVAKKESTKVSSAAASASVAVSKEEE